MFSWIKLTIGGLAIVLLSFWTTLTIIDNYMFLRPLVKAEGLSIEGLSGGWISSAGIKINTDAHDLVQFPFIVLEGPTNPFASELKPTAAVIGLTRKLDAPIASIFKRIGSSYRIVIDARGAASAESTPIKIVLTFDRFFVPKEQGINADERELVIVGPSKYEMRAFPPE